MIEQRLQAYRNLGITCLHNNINKMFFFKLFYWKIIAWAAVAILTLAGIALSIKGCVDLSQKQTTGALALIFGIILVSGAIATYFFGVRKVQQKETEEVQRSIPTTGSLGTSAKWFGNTFF